MSSSSSENLVRPVTESTWLGYTRYVPPWGFSLPNMLRFSKWIFSSSHRNRPAPPDQQSLDKDFPVHELKVDLHPKVPQVYWLGHASVLFCFPNGSRVLCDPVATQRCSPMSFAGPQRLRRFPCTLESLPKIDAVCISHNHYDHMDYEFLSQLAARQPDTLFIAGLGEQSRLRKMGCQNIKEMTWWEDIAVNDRLTIHMVPANHWCCRNYLTDYNTSLWGGYVMKCDKYSAYFAGDTGYQSDIFNQIGSQFNGVDLSAIPIGAYCPRWIMQAQHVDPAEAVLIHKEVKSRRSLGIHWGTFRQMADESFFEPRDTLKLECTAHRLADDEFVTIEIGDFLEGTCV